jgi:hypothetical protein
MAKEFHRATPLWVAATLFMTVALLNGCVGNGAGLDANGNPLSSAPASSAPSSAPGPVSADFQSIQDNVFTPICTRCHSGAGAPEGLQLDAAHSYALLVGVPSAEEPDVLRVKPGDPTNSYLIQKLENASGIVGAQMPYGGPYLPQATIDMISQWITAGAPPAAATSASVASVQAERAQAEPVQGAPLVVVATTPVDGGAMTAPVRTIAIGLNQQPDISFLNGAVSLQRIGAEPFDIPTLIGAAEGNPATVLLTPAAALPPGTYRVTLRGGSPIALTRAGAESLPADYSFTFTVESP